MNRYLIKNLFNCLIILQQSINLRQFILSRSHTIMNLPKCIKSKNKITSPPQKNSNWKITRQCQLTCRSVHSDSQFQKAKHGKQIKHFLTKEISLPNKSHDHQTSYETVTTAWHR